MFLARFSIRAATVFNSRPATQSLVNSPIVRELRLGSTLREAKEAEEEQGVELKDASKDRSTEVPVETSIKYLKSKAYATTYGSDPVWKHYRRNHKGSIPPRKTRKTCIRGGEIATGNPCPICRDEYLVLHPENIDLIKQFISPHNGETLSYRQTGICQKRHQQLLVAIEVAKDRGLISFDVPFREYDYSLYQKKS